MSEAIIFAGFLISMSILIGCGIIADQIKHLKK